MSFSTVKIEGGLFGPEILEAMLSGSIGGQKPADFNLESRRNLTDEIAGQFTYARAFYGMFRSRLEKLAETDMSTTLTRDAWMIPFLGLLGFELQYNQRAREVDGLSFAVSHRAGRQEDAPPVHIVGARQDLGKIAVGGRPRLAPHSLIQEYLNRTDQVWGIVTNGLTLRLLRDSTFIRRQAYVEFDLVGMLEEQKFQDFSVLYRLMHRSRFPRGLDDSRDCLLEKYHAQAEEQGGRVREKLRDGVEKCITLLGNGFLSHPENADLRDRIANGSLKQEDYFRQLLRLIYRFLFLLVSEDRGIFGSDDLYRDHYGVGRLRRNLERRGQVTGHVDLWQSLRLLWRILQKEDFAELVRVTPLNGELFGHQDLDDCLLANRDLLDAFSCLAMYQQSPSASPRPVNYAALDVEELGSVYESLLEFHPVIDRNGSGRPVFELQAGSERKTTGSYYTPPCLVNELVKSALDPVLEERLKKARQTADAKGADRAGAAEKAILTIRVCDPACGSGHFLLAAARRLGKELARIRTREDEPAPEEYRKALRDTVSHCIYGVDKNPLAVDLCRVALWIESHAPGKPLGFIDHRIRCGDSLVGVFDLSDIGKGIPNEAFKPLEGDDRDTARAAADRNASEKMGVRDLFVREPEHSYGLDQTIIPDLDGIEDDSTAEIRRKREMFEASHADRKWTRKKQACDLWTAAFFQRLVPGVPVITSGALDEHLLGRHIDPRLLASAAVLASRNRFFHWPLEFPEVFSLKDTEEGKAGFDVVLSNPPWERVKLQEQEFFAARDMEIAGAPNKAARTRMISALETRNPDLYREYLLAVRDASAISAFLRHSERYPLNGRGDINTYAVFAEIVCRLINREGLTGFIVPSGIATDDTTRFYFQDLMQSGSLISLYDFENRRKLFPAVDSRMKFSLVTARKLGIKHKIIEKAEFIFFAHSIEDMKDTERRFSLTAQEISLINPNTGNCPIFRSNRDAELTKAIYRRVPVLWQEASDARPEKNPWGISFRRLFDMANDSHHFRTLKQLEKDGFKLDGNVFTKGKEKYLPLYEAKMIHQFDHRWATYEMNEDGEPEARDVTIEEKKDPFFVVQPRYWVNEETINEKFPQYPEPLGKAISIHSESSMLFILCLWSAGYYLMMKDYEKGRTILKKSDSFQCDPEVYLLLKRIPEVFEDSLVLGLNEVETLSVLLNYTFPLDLDDIKKIQNPNERLENITSQLMMKRSLKYFLGWRDITNSTNERTLIASIVPRTAIGNKIPVG